MSRRITQLGSRLLGMLGPLRTHPTSSPGTAMHFESLKTLHGEPVPADAWTNHVVLFVNVASKCGFTSQYKGLQALHLEKAPQGLVVVGVPCNQFGQQEPGSAETIHTFCELNYGVTFPLLEKQDVNGPNRSALYAQLVASEAGDGRDIGWNFEKFLVGRDGTVLARFSSRFGPKHRKLKAAIDQALAD